MRTLPPPDFVISVHKEVSQKVERGHYPALLGDFYGLALRNMHVSLDDVQVQDFWEDWEGC